MFRSGKSMALAYLLYFVLVAVLGGFIINSFKSKPAAPSKPPVHQQTARPAPATPPPAQSKTTPSTGSTLTDTGPGDAAGLFVLTSVAGAGLYRYYLVRRLTRSR